MDVATSQCKTEDDVIAAGKGCSGLLSQYAPMNAKVFKALPEVRIVSRMGAGYDTVNVSDARQYGVWVANSPDYGIGEVATHALGMALSLVRHIPWYHREIQAGRWNYAGTGGLARASELTLGILGLGRIGKRMSYIARNVFGPVIACDPYLIDGDFPAYVERVGKDELFRKSDVVSLHVPLNDETRGIVDGRLLGLMKKGSYLVNTSRGAVRGGRRRAGGPGIRAPGRRRARRASQGAPGSGSSDAPPPPHAPHAPRRVLLGGG
jgi:D-3-phosphoglycerate dehydrogenase